MRDIELLWDTMYRSTINYGRKGLPLQAISAVDLALWDALGKVTVVFFSRLSSSSRRVRRVA